MGRSIKIASTRELRPGMAKLVNLDGEDVAVFCVGSELYAVSNLCPHQHFSMLHRGSLGDSTVTCPMHGRTFDLRTGRCLNGDGRLRKFEILIEGEDIMIQLGS